MSLLGPIDPVCLSHGKRASEHPQGYCLFCCVCFVTLTPEECSIADGHRQDVCWKCADEEAMVGAVKRARSCSCRKHAWNPECPAHRRGPR